MLSVFFCTVFYLMVLDMVMAALITHNNFVYLFIYFVVVKQLSKT